MPTTQSLLDAALALGQWLNVLVLRLDLRTAQGGNRRRLRDGAGALLMQLADASVCRRRSRVLILLDRAAQYATRIDVLLAQFAELGVLRHEDEGRAAAAREKLAELRAILDRLSGPKPDLRLLAPQEDLPTASPPASLGDGGGTSSSTVASRGGAPSLLASREEADGTAMDVLCGPVDGDPATAADADTTQPVGAAGVESARPAVKEDQGDAPADSAAPGAA